MDSTEVKIRDKKVLGNLFRNVDNLEQFVGQASAKIQELINAGGGDLTEIQNAINELNSDVDVINDQITTINGDISALQTSVTVNTQNILALTNTDEAQNTRLTTLESKSYKNRAGQVKVNYTGLSLTNFTATTNQTFNIGSATHTISASPTTIWPYGSSSDYATDFYVANRLRENNKLGQVHRWRIIGSYANKAAANNGSLIIEIINPDSGFTSNVSITLPSNTTAESFTAEILTIADNASLAVGAGYQLRARTSFADNDFTVSIASITRVSEATEVDVI
ncbi:hypothetical protein [Neisseria sp. Ec49-e6-T10]|uniref:hypothetical protein n=1 Tax=Neisseria sp. Ec49-e6-T10 TaxID=3140744 RepID=UPI003EBF8592